MASALGGGGGGKGGSSSGSGLSAQDIAAVQQGLGQSIQQLGSRYQQLGLGVPDPTQFGGDPLTAAQQGGSLQFGKMGTAQQTDISGLQDMAQAALGQLQTANATNAAIPGTTANTLQGIQNQNQLNSLATQQANNNLFSSGAGLGTGA